MAQFPIKNALLQGTLDGTPASGTVDLSALTLTVPVASLRIGTSVQAYDADLTTWAGVTPAAGITTFLTTPTSANLLAAVTNETGTGSLVFATSPTLVTPALGTPSALTLTNATGLPVSGIAASTTLALGVGSIELGHATDTTIARVSAGVISVEGATVRTGTVAVANGGTGSTALPKFAAYMSADQTIATATMVKVAFDTEVFDTNTNYDPTTNYRFTPTVAGKYLVGGHVYFGTTVGAAGVSIFIRKNGADYARLDQKAGSATITIMGGSTLIDMNGSSDYLEFFVFQDSGSNKTITAGASIGQFWASILP